MFFCNLPKITLLKRRNEIKLIIWLNLSSQATPKINHFHHLTPSRLVYFQCFHRFSHNHYATTSCMYERRCYYQVLNLKKFAPTQEIKSAYYAIAKKCHPDVNSGDTNAAEKFREVSEAYEILSDDSKRAHYDAGLSSHSSSGNIRKESHNYGDWWTHTKRWEEAEPDEDFKCHKRWTDWNRGTKKRKTNNESFDYEFNGYMFRHERTIKITMQQAAQGLKRDFKIPHPLRKSDKGKLSASLDINPGIEDKKVLQVIIDDIMEVLVTIHIKKSWNLKRIGSNVYSTCWIPNAMSKSGGTILLQGLYGELELDIPAGTRSHTNFRLSEQGFKVSNSDKEFGDHYVFVKVNESDYYRSWKRKNSYHKWKRKK